ncbi:conserved hypothetical protein [Talaromyces stipitatus ATCC 10500]|uniref:BTB domain-containing protein n=1 Tax=Talaromyces stipitatus (strain ATCC 10500 / CBS 375.48 / QM 6759 / NRRL 1006) TaxID=441959 RepID=B8M3D9_TALSN|nr:uncharacterized protein TSTA_095600 [Talaromyces stipitatus ATCC 10500]EED22311.1 conserved hypothetical protein [Talaromyces stipitatus ATCC 10500]
MVKPEPDAEAEGIIIPQSNDQTSNQATQAGDNHAQSSDQAEEQASSESSNQIHPSVSQFGNQTGVQTSTDHDSITEQIRRTYGNGVQITEPRSRMTRAYRDYVYGDRYFAPRDNEGHPPGHFADLVRYFYQDDEFSDLTIRLRDHKFRVHKMVLCRQSHKFAELVKGMNRYTKTLTLPNQNIDVAAFKAMLAFLYGFRYEGRIAGSPMAQHFTMVHMGFDFDIYRLKKYALKRVKEVTEFLCIIPEFISDLDQELARGLTGDIVLPLYVMILNVCRVNIFWLLKYQAFNDVLDTKPGFAHDLLTTLGDEYPAYWCLSCYARWHRAPCPGCRSEENWAKFFH